jgi:serine/threonine protein kinase
MDADLAVVLETTRGGLDSGQVRFLMYQILKGLKYLHTSHVIHRDLVRCAFFSFVYHSMFN